MKRQMIPGPVPVVPKSSGGVAVGAAGGPARWRWLGVVLLLIPATLGAFWFFRGNAENASAGGQAAATPAGYISRAEFTDRYGVEIVHIGPAVGGGIVDFRFRIVDPVKAGPFLNDPRNQPVLTVLDSGQTLTPTHVGGRPRGGAGNGAGPYSFYPNINHAVKDGSRVSVAFGGIRVEPLAATTADASQ